jgi:hypothetical protein
MNENYDNGRQRNDGQYMSKMMSLQNQTACEPDRAPQIPRAQENLDHHLEVLMKTVFDVQTRLQPVLRAEPNMRDQSAKECPVPTAPANTVFARIDVSAAVVAEATSHLREILRTLEV